MHHVIRTVFLAVALSIFNAPLHAKEGRYRAEAIGILSRHLPAEYVIEQMNHKDVCARYVLPPQKYLLLKELREQVLTEKSLAAGEALFRQHRPLLEKLANGDEFLPYYIVAVLRIESDFGKNLGTEPALRTFYKSYVERRATKSISHSEKPLVDQAVPLLRYAQTLGIDPCTIYGSSSGAIGLPQFMPLSLELARDGDGDGVIDILKNVYDAMASIVSFFRDRQWGKRSRFAVLRSYCGSGPYAKSYAAIGETYALRVKKRVEGKHD